MTNIHPTAIVSKSAAVDPSAKIGPYCLIGPNVKLGAECVLHGHVVIDGHTEIGRANEIYPFASIGHAPQDLKYKGEPSQLIIGDKNIIREHVTMNPGTEGGGMVTRIGSGCAFLASSHVGHDSIVGNHVVFSNNVMLAGHCHVDDFAILGGGVGVHQFVRVGKHAFLGGMSAVENDVIPYGSVVGNRAYLAGLNIVGLKRRNFNREQVHAMRAAYRMLFADEGTLRERVEDVAQLFKDHESVMEIVNFIRQESDRSICMPRQERT